MIRLTTFIVFYLATFLVSYAQISTEEITIKNNKIELPGTLTFTQKRSPLLIWIHGSGNVDRNGNQNPVIKANYVQQFREAVNQKGIAFFSYDKRTANPKNKEYLHEILFNDFVSDAKKVISYFKKNQQFSSIIIIGHSQGSLVGMLASDEANKYISLAGASTPIDSVIIDQVTKQAPFLSKIVDQHFKELKQTGSIKTVNPMLMSILAPQNHKFINSWLEYNPSKEIEKIQIPTLIINGTKDFQVETTHTKALQKAQPNAKLVIINDMNHILKHITKPQDNQNSYFSPDFPLSKELVETIVDFVNQ